MFAMLFSPILTGLLGAIIGSFLALVSVRLPREEEVAVTPSHCRSCQTRLSPLNLVPILSWLWQRGRCAACAAPVSRRYPLIEAAAAAIGVWAALSSPELVMIAATAVLGWQLLLIAIVDAEHFWLPDILTWPLAATGLIAAGVLAQGPPWPQILGAAAGFGLLWGMAWLYEVVRRRQGLGGGDPFLFGAIGAWVGIMGLPSVLLYACAVGLAVVLARLIVRRSISGDDRLPFGSFLAVGGWLTWLYGPLGL
jgi:leader peptidase (prepilin peptidase)/N-methyltransferase